MGALRSAVMLQRGTGITCAAAVNHGLGVRNSPWLPDRALLQGREPV